ncbi:MAG TPA: hydrogenase maturation nickel metallochaperone HypA [Woeseiaceae bacterium]|nr:hydrogenase maturation nickel metallochaperone HypA [Woeseiaceae bacterium]
MHELGISRNIVAIVSDAAKGRRVCRVTLEIGRLSGVLTDAVAFCFDAVSQGTVVAGAALEIREIEGRARCAACGAEFPVPQLPAACTCGSRRSTLVAGEELNIKSMELEEVA